jgi:RNA polymerase-binding transcription factor
MNVQEYRQRLIDLEARLSTRVEHVRQQAREQAVDSPRDAGDDSVADEGESEDFTQAELDSTVLQQVRDALQRIADGSFGRCVVDGEPIEPHRLEAVPWTPYCLKHQTLLEGRSESRMPSL